MEADSLSGGNSDARSVSQLAPSPGFTRHSAFDLRVERPLPGFGSSLGRFLPRSDPLSVRRCPAPDTLRPYRGGTGLGPVVFRRTKGDDHGAVAPCLAREPGQAASLDSPGAEDA